MEPLVFIDIEVNPQQNQILDIAALKHSGEAFHSNSVQDLVHFLKGGRYICGHNIIRHDLKYISKPVQQAGILLENAIDTLHLSPLLFPKEPYHALLKDDKLQTEDKNNPLNDSKKAKHLLFDEIEAFKALDDRLRQIYYFLLRDTKEFSAFFKFMNYSRPVSDLEKLILARFSGKICSNVNLLNLFRQSPIELAYCLALTDTDSRNSITPAWVHKNYPDVERVMFLLRNKACITGCKYCDQALDIRSALQRFFGFEDYRTFDGEPLQEKAVQAAVDNKSILAVAESP